MCTVLLPPGANPIAFNKYMYLYPLLLRLDSFFRHEHVGTGSNVCFFYSFVHCLYFVQRKRGKENDYVIVLALYVSLTVNM